MGFATEAQRKSSVAEMDRGAHPRGDGKYAQLVEGGGDRGAAWRTRQRGAKEIG
jgi:hypothetical protein